MDNDHLSFDNRSFAGSVQSVYTVSKEPNPMIKTNKTVHDILKVNLLNSKRRNRFFYPEGFEETLGNRTLEQRSRLDTISKSVTSIRGLPRMGRQACVNPSHLSMEASIYEINSEATLNRNKFRNNSGPSGNAINGTGPTQQLSSSTLKGNPNDTFQRKTLAEIFNDIGPVLSKHCGTNSSSEHENSNVDSFTHPKTVTPDQKKTSAQASQDVSPQSNSKPNVDLDQTTTAATITQTDSMENTNSGKIDNAPGDNIVKHGTVNVA